MLTGLRKNFKVNNLDFDIVKPFGPTILETKLPKEILEAMIELSDGILSDEKRESWGAHLVGQIEEEPKISNELLKEFKVLDYLKQIYSEYVMGCMYADSPPDYKAQLDDVRKGGVFNNPINISIQSAWVVSQKVGEYNPVHLHSEASLSSVMYLKVPTDEPKSIPNKINTDGCIDFVDRSVSDPLQTATTRIKPKVGYFYIFPASLLHLVYPFKGKEERRSVSINVNYKIQY